VDIRGRKWRQAGGLCIMKKLHDLYSCYYGDHSKEDEMGGHVARIGEIRYT
jgi:hypothetical protein